MHVCRDIFLQILDCELQLSFDSLGVLISKLSSQCLVLSPPIDEGKCKLVQPVPLVLSKSGMLLDYFYTRSSGSVRRSRQIWS